MQDTRNGVFILVASQLGMTEAVFAVTPSETIKVPQQSLLMTQSGLTRNTRA